MDDLALIAFALPEPLVKALHRHGRHWHTLHNHNGLDASALQRIAGAGRNNTRAALNRYPRGRTRLRSIRCRPRARELELNHFGDVGGVITNTFQIFGNE